MSAAGKHVAVLMGGWSAEREVSLVSGAAVERALAASGYRVTGIDVTRDLPATLAALDGELERVLTTWLDAAGIPWGAAERGGRRVFHIGASPRLAGSAAGGLTVALGPARDLADIESLHLAHPLIEAAVAEARRAGAGPFRVRFRLGRDVPEVLRRRHGARGRLALTRTAHRGFEREDRLRVTAVFEGRGGPASGGGRARSPAAALRRRRLPRSAPRG